GCSTNVSPISEISVVTTFNNPFGKPASSNIFAIIVPPAIVVCSCGFRTTPLPAPSAGATDFIDKKNGKLNGLMTPTTPTGTRYTLFSFPSVGEGRILPSMRNGKVD